MSRAIRALRRADPARDLPDRPDERAEEDLRAILATEPASDRVARVRRGPLVVTALVTAAVVAVSAAVLLTVRPRADVAVPAPTTSATLSPPYELGTCSPVAALPFQCGVFRSTYGGKAITGTTGGPVDDPLEISYVPQQGALVLAARSRCLAAAVPVRFDGRRLLPAGEPVFTGGDCGADPGTGSWAYTFLTGALRTRDGSIFGGDDDAVFFEYQGAAPIGEAQWQRSELTCVPAHVEPFGCATYTAVSGTGTLAFLAEHPTSMRLDHLNGELTMEFGGWCNSLSAGVAVDGRRLVPYGVGGTTAGCVDDSRPQRDGALQDFFSEVLTFDQAGDRVTFTSADGTSSATFAR